MATRALKVFRVAHAGIRLQVRLLPSVLDVDASYRDGKRRNERALTHAYFRPSTSVFAQHHGLIVLAIDGNLDEEVPHEVTHAVVHCLRGVSASADEPAAYAVGVLSAKIFAIARPLAVRHH